MAIFGMDGNVDDFYWDDGDNTFIHIDSHNYGINRVNHRNHTS